MQKIFRFLQDYLFLRPASLKDQNVSFLYSRKLSTGGHILPVNMTKYVNKALSNYLHFSHIETTPRNKKTNLNFQYPPRVGMKIGIDPNRG